MSNRGFARTRDSMLHVHDGVAVTFRVDLLIVIFLLILFGLIGAHSYRILRPAFQAAYSSHTSVSSQNTSDLPLNLGEEVVFHKKYFNPQVIRWESEIIEWSHHSKLPPDLIAIVIQIESCGDVLASSPAGAMGIFQVMPFHFGSDEDPFDPQVNATRGLDYLALGYTSSGKNIPRTLAGYNGGHSMLDAAPALWPDETQRYVLWGTGIWEDIQAGRYPSPTLERWMDAGGERLCSAAAASNVSSSSY